MTILNGRKLLEAAPLDPMVLTKQRAHGVTWGLSEAGYDLRIMQDVRFKSSTGGRGEAVMEVIVIDAGAASVKRSRFTLASTIERFQMPNDLVGVVHDKSTWARQGLSVFNTVIEPGWHGYLTLELVYHGDGDLHIPAGAGIAQVIFHGIGQPASYGGKYQHQPSRPVAAIMEKG